jgi:PAS domain S-box-containing protein
MAPFDATFGAGTALPNLALRVLQDAPVLLLILDLEGRIKHVNPFFERLTGYSLDEARDRDWFDTFLPARDRAAHRALFARSAAGEHVRDHVNPIVTRGGEERQIAWTDEFLRADDGEPTAILAIGRDVSEHRRAEQALRANEERLRSLIESTPAGVAMLDRELRYIACSRRWISDYRLEGQELVGRRHYDVFPEIPERWREVHRRCLTGVSQRCDEDRFERADGSVQYLRWAIEPWRDPSGAVGGVIFFTEDVTDRKRAELELRANEERLRILIESTPAGVAMLDRELRYIACSRRWISDYQLEGKELLGRSHYEVFPELPARWKEIHRRCLTGVSQRCDEDRFERADGAVQYERWAIEPWRDPRAARRGRPRPRVRPPRLTTPRRWPRGIARSMTASTASRARCRPRASCAASRSSRRSTW